MRSLTSLLFLLQLAACKDDLRITVVGTSLADKLAGFKIKNSENLISAPSFAMQWTLLGENVNYRALISLSSSCAGEPIKTQSTQELSTTIENLGNGRYYLCLFADVADVSYPAANNGHAFVVYRAQADEVQGIPTYAADFNIENPLDDISGLEITWVQEKGPGTVIFDDIHTLKPKTRADKDGFYVIKGELKDITGQTATITRSFLWDQTPPVFTSAALVNAALDAFINAQERLDSKAIIGNVAGEGYVVIEYRIIAANGICEGSLDFSESIPQANSTILAADGRYQTCIKLKDESGLLSYGRSDAFTVDTVPASFTSIALAGPATDASINPAEHLTALDLVALPVVTDASTIQYALADGAGSCSGPLSYASTIPKSDDSRFILAGNYKVCVKVQDQALNTAAYGSSSVISYTLSSPVFTSLLGVNEASDALINDSEKNSALAAWALTASAYLTSNYTVALDDTAGTLSCDASKTYSQASIPLISSLSDGNWVICVKLTDAASVVTYGKSQKLVRDTVGPVYTSLAVSGAAADSYINDSEKLLTTALFTLTASGQNTADYTLALDDTGGVVCNGTQNYNQSSIATPASLAADLPYAVCVKLTDSAGNITYGKSAQITRDIVSPSFTSLNSANEASDLFIKSGEEASALALFSLSSSGATIFAYTVALSDSPTAVTCDGSNTYSLATVPVVSSISSDGIYAVCSRLRDAAGNTSYGKSQSVVRDTVAPVFTSLLGINEASNGLINDSEKASILSAWALTASGASATDYTVPLDDTAAAVVCNNTQTYNQSSMPHVDAMTSDKPWAICVRLRDAAGNTTYGKSQQIVRDIAAPSFTSLALSGAGADGFINNSERLLTTDLWALTASGQTATDYAVALSDSGSSLVCDGSKTFSQSTIATPASISSDGTFALCIRLSDAAGNIVYGKSVQVVRDIVAPTFTSLLGANEASDLFIKNGEEASGLALLILSSSGATAIDYTLALDDSGAGVSCNISQTYGQSTIALISDLSIDGSHAVCVRLSDAAGNITYGKSSTIQRDLTAPTFTSLNGTNEASDTYINNSEKNSTLAAWTLTASGHVSAAYSLPLDDTGAAVVCNAAKSYSESAIATIDSITSDGAWAHCVKLLDAAGNITYGKSQQLVRDSGLPTFTSLALAGAGADGYVNDSEKALATALWTLSASGQSATAYTVALDDTAGALVCNSGKTYSEATIATAVSLLADGPFALCVRLSDAAGNIIYGKSSQLTRDVVLPTFTSLARINEAADGVVNNGEKNETNPLWALTASGASVTSYTLALDDTASALVCDGSKTYDQGTTVPTALSIGSDSTWNVCVKLEDAAGNVIYGKGQSTTRTTAGPTFTSLALNAAASDGFINDSEKLLVSALWALTAAGQVATDYTVALSDTGGSLVCNASKTYDQASIPTPASLGSDGVYALCVRLTDGSANVTYGKSAQITRDIVAPAFTSLNGANESTDLYIKSGEETSNLALFTLSASGQSSSTYTVATSDDPAAVVCDSGKTYGQSSVPLINSIGSDGKYAVCVKLSDAAGNNTYGKSQQVERDIVLPVFTSLAGANQASDGYVNDSEKASTSAAWALTATGHTVINYTLPLDDTGAAVACNSGKTYGQAAIAQVDALTSDKAWVICAQLSDAAGNISYGKSQAITRDILVPTFTSLAVAGAALDSYINDSEKALATALWSLNASGHASVDYTVAIDDTAAALVCDAGKTYNQASIATAASLGADGPFALCVKLTDAAGNIGYGKSAQIVRDIVAPTFTSLNGLNEGSDTYINNSEKNALNALWTLSSSGSSSIDYTVALSDTAAALVCDVSKTYNQSTTVATANSIASDGAWSICVRLTDAAGNISYGKGQQLTRDIIAPTFTSLALNGAASDAYINDSEKLLVSDLWALTASGQSTTDYTLALDDTAGALVCNSGKTYGQAAIATPATLSTDGAYALCVKLTDTAGNITYGKSVQLTREIVVPIFTSLNGTNEASDLYIKSGEENSGQALYVLVSSGSTSINYTVALSDDPVSVTCDSGKTYGQSSIVAISSVASDGKYVVCVKLSDDAGNNTYGKSQQVERDIVAPSFTSLNGANEASDGYINNSEKSSALAGWALVASGQSSTNYSVPLDDTTSAVVCNAAKTYNQSAIPHVDAMNADNPWAICVKLVDAAGNITYGKSQQVIRDIIAPTFTSLAVSGAASDSYINDSEKLLVSPLWALTASGQSATDYTLALDDTSTITCDVSKTYNQAAIPIVSALSSDLPYALCVRLGDAAGNLTYGKSAQVVRDIAAPTFTSLNRQNEGSDSYIKDTEKTATNALWVLSASGGGTPAYSLALDDSGAALVCDNSKTYGQGTTVPTANTIATDGSWSVCVKLTDSSGNIAYGKGQQIVRDIVYPTFTSLALAGDAIGGYINDSEKLLVSAMWTLTASGQSTTDYTTAQSDTSSALACNISRTYDQAAIATPASLSSDGAYAMCVRLTDTAGNITYGKSAQVTRDIVFPTFTSLNGNGVASDLYIKSGEESSTNPLYALVASNQTSTNYTLAQDDSTPITCNSGQTYGQSSIALVNSLSSDGVYALCVKLSDDAGNNSYGKSQQVARDIVAPVFTSLLGNSVASDGYINDSEKASANPAWALIASGQSSTTYTAALSDTGGALVCNVSQTYGSGSIALISSITPDGAYASCVRLADAAGNITYGKSQQLTRDIVTPSTPTAFAATVGYRYVDLKWTDGGSSYGYLVVRSAAGGSVTFAPTAGTAYSTGAQGSDQIIYVGTANIKMDNLLSIATYAYKVYAYDLALNYTAAASVSATPATPCASNWVFVPGDPDFGTKDFCMMKHEAKDVSGVATSQTTGTTMLKTQDDTMLECSALGRSYHMINNDEWMTAATHLAQQANNWSSGSLGSGNLFRGHSDNSPTTACAAGATDLLAYVETNCTAKAAGGGENDETTQRRTMYTAAQEVVWDMAGNNAEYVNYSNYAAANRPTPSNAFTEFSSVVTNSTQLIRTLVPTAAIKSFWNDSWSASSQGIGTAYFTNVSGHVPKRGGYYDGDANAGLFTYIQWDPPTVTNDGAPRCVQSLQDLDAATLALAAADSQITATWTTVGGASGYILVRGPAGSLPSFQPVNGTAYTAGAQGSDTILYAGAALTYINTGLDNGREYHYALYSYNASTVYAGPARSKDTPILCPTGFVLVPGDSAYGTKDFCLMKYEAKSIGGVAASGTDGSPWANISQYDAITACNAMGPGYQLVSNGEWMTASSNAAAIGSNWSSGTVGTGNLYSGHNDSSPSNSCAASSNDVYPYVEGNCVARRTGEGEDSESTQRRTTNFSNGSVVWDLTGNVEEWVNSINKTNKPYVTADSGPLAATKNFTQLNNGLTKTSLSQLIPTNAVKSFWSDAWTTTQAVGQYYAGTNSSGGAMTRGGRYNAGMTFSGLFTTILNSDPATGYAHIGFRCSLSGQLPNTPKTFVATVDKNSVALSWAKDGSTTAGYLLVRGAAGKLPIFQPANGTPYTAGAQGTDTVLYVGTALSKLDTSLTTGGTYHYRVYGYDSSNNYSSGALQSVKVSPCAENFVFVPGEVKQGTRDFCIMKYEAVNNGGSFVSTTVGTPWVSITPSDALTKCSAMGTGYHLITNDEWMTASTQLVARGANWSSGTVGTATFYQGHGDNNPASVCAASTDDTLAFVETSCTPIGVGGGENSETTQKRTMSFASGEVIWDITGDAYEWVNSFNNGTKPTPTTAAAYEYTAVTASTSVPKSYLIPTNALFSFWNDSWTTSQGIGTYYPGPSATGGYWTRGGAYGSSGPGLFAAALNTTDTGVSHIGFRCTQSVADDDTSSLALYPNNLYIGASWSTVSGASGYVLVRGPANAAPTFMPVNGSSYTPGETQGSDKVIYAGTSLSVNDASQTNGSAYTYVLYSYDVSNNYKFAAIAHEAPVSCPTGFVLVPGDKDYGTDDFCVMKYEAKSVSSVATSQAALAPWATISQETARSQCAALGHGYGMISNPGWMTMGANIAALNGNWTGGSIGNGGLFVGHTDNSPTLACAASSNDAQFYVETTCSPASTGDTTDQRRTFTLSNSVVIWDLPSNVYEWINYINSTDKPGATNAWYEYTALTGTTTTVLKELIPTTAVKAYWSNAWNSANGLGKFYPAINSSGGSLTRGGGWDSGSVAGLFAATLDHAPSFADTDVGFRCSYTPP